MWLAANKSAIYQYIDKNVNGDASFIPMLKSLTEGNASSIAATPIRAEDSSYDLLMRLSLILGSAKACGLQLISQLSISISIKT
jgi:hypothetical protein